MFVCQRVNPGQAKTRCRLKTKVALHGFAKVAHYYKRSLAHTSMTPNMITRCEKRPTSPSAWGVAKNRLQQGAHDQNHIPELRHTPYHVWISQKKNKRFDLIERTSLTLVHGPLIKDQVEP